MEETYPAGVPKHTKRTSVQVIKAPRFAGDRNPRQANTYKRLKLGMINILEKDEVPCDTGNELEKLIEYKVNLRELCQPCKGFACLIQGEQRAAFPSSVVETHLHEQVSIQTLLGHLRRSQFDYIVLCLCEGCAIESLPPFQTKKALSPKNLRSKTTGYWYGAYCQVCSPNESSI